MGNESFGCPALAARMGNKEPAPGLRMSGSETEVEEWETLQR
jgi:hypothetical protein